MRRTTAHLACVSVLEVAVIAASCGGSTETAPPVTVTEEVQATVSLTETVTQTVAETVIETETVTVTDTVAAPAESKPNEESVEVLGGDFAGLYSITDAKPAVIFGSPGVRAKIRYLRTGSCPPGDVFVEANFYRDGELFDTGEWYDDVPNDGTPRVMEIYASNTDSGPPPERVELLIAQADCE